ncbi:MAG: hypothetical protein LBP73_11045, partial [Clostridiales Family XIII bacterium]|nr:hypothetical protein [Clostridiales Family XIII bacterium]
DCEKTIKIPGLGWGSDSHNKNEGHITLKEGKNFVYEFTPEAVGDILFTCWMGSGCHANHIRVTAGEGAAPGADAAPGENEAPSEDAAPSAHPAI